MMSGSRKPKYLMTNSNPVFICLVQYPCGKLWKSPVLTTKVMAYVQLKQLFYVQIYYQPLTRHINIQLKTEILPNHIFTIRTADIQITTIFYKYKNRL